MSTLSYFSTLGEIINSTDSELRENIGFLDPKRVTEYVFYLREQVYNASYTADSTAIPSVHKLPKPLTPMNIIRATGVFAKGTSKNRTKFSINLVQEDETNNFHLDFRPPPHENCIVMNTKFSGKWEKEIRSTIPVLKHGKIFSVAITCKESMFEVNVNGVKLDQTFPYRYPLHKVTRIVFREGPEALKWINLKCS